MASYFFFKINPSANDALLNFLEALNAIPDTTNITSTETTGAQ